MKQIRVEELLENKDKQVVDIEILIDNDSFRNWDRHYKTNSYSINIEGIEFKQVTFVMGFEVLEVSTYDPQGNFRFFLLNGCILHNCTFKGDQSCSGESLFIRNCELIGSIYSDSCISLEKCKLDNLKEIKASDSIFIENTSLGLIHLSSYKLFLYELDNKLPASTKISNVIEFILNKYPIIFIPSVTIGSVTKFFYGFYRFKRLINMRANSVGFKNCNLGDLCFVNCKTAEFDGCKLYGTWFYSSFAERIFAKKIQGIDIPLHEFSLENLNLKNTFCSYVYFNGVYKYFTLNNVFLKYGECHPIIENKVQLDNVKFDRTELELAFIANHAIQRNQVNIQKAKLVDRWVMLRETYTGVGLLWVLLFTFIFFLPYLSQVAYYIIVSAVPEAKLPPHEIKPLWDVLLFSNKEGGEKTAYAILGISLVVYNITRFFMTMFLSKHRENEEYLKQNNFSPSRPHETKFMPYWYAHKWFIKPVFWLSLAASAWRFWDVLHMNAVVFSA